MRECGGRWKDLETLVRGLATTNTYSSAHHQGYTKAQKNINKVCEKYSCFFYILYCIYTANYEANLVYVFFW